MKKLTLTSAFLFLVFTGLFIPALAQVHSSALVSVTYHPTTSNFNERVWVPGHWKVDQWGNRYWVEGRWVTRPVRGRNGRLGRRHRGNATCPPAARALSPVQFDRAMASIANARFEGTRQEIALSVISRNYLTSNQVREMLFLFDFENTRLRIAKRAAYRTVDLNNYFVTFEAFRFDSSIRQLERHLARM